MRRALAAAPVSARRLDDPVRVGDVAALRRLSSGRRPAGGPPRHWRVTRAELLGAFLPGSRRARSYRELMRAFHADPRLALVRHASRRDNLVATMRYIARRLAYADGRGWLRGMWWAVRESIAEACSYSVSTWKECRRTLEAWGWVAIVRHGRSEAARRMSREHALWYPGNDAQVYGACIPPMPSWRSLIPRPQRSRCARRAIPAAPAATATPRTRPPTQSAALRIDTPEHAVDASTDSRTALRAGSPPEPARGCPRAPGDGLEKLTDRARARAWAPFGRAGWTQADWLWAVAHRPDGTRHERSVSAARYPASALRWRLWLWCHPDTGLPRMSRSQLAEAARITRQLAETARQLAGQAAAETAWGALHDTPHPGAARARAALASIRKDTR